MIIIRLFIFFIIVVLCFKVRMRTSTKAVVLSCFVVIAATSQAPFPDPVISANGGVEFRLKGNFSLCVLSLSPPPPTPSPPHDNQSTPQLLSLFLTLGVSVFVLFLFLFSVPVSLSLSVCLSVYLSFCSVPLCLSVCFSVYLSFCSRLSPLSVSLFVLCWWVVYTMDPHWTLCSCWLKTAQAFDAVVVVSDDGYRLVGFHFNVNKPLHGVAAGEHAYDVNTKTSKRLWHVAFGTFSLTTLFISSLAV